MEWPWVTHHPHSSLVGLSQTKLDYWATEESGIILFIYLFNFWNWAIFFGDMLEPVFLDFIFLIFLISNKFIYEFSQPGGKKRKRAGESIKRIF